VNSFCFNRFELIGWGLLVILIFLVGVLPVVADQEVSSELKGTDSTFSVKVDYPQTVPHLSDRDVYPDFVLGMTQSKGWWFGGATEGNGGAIKVVDAPGRPGQKALEFSFTANKAAPRWFEWRYDLSPQLSVFGAKEIVFDLFPLDELTMDIIARFGTQQGSSILPICWQGIGRHKPGKWVEVRLPIMTMRCIDNIKFDLDNQAQGVPYGKPVRFVISNLRFEPTPSPIAEVPIAGLETKVPVKAVYLEFPKGLTIVDSDTLVLHLEVGVSKNRDAVLQILDWKTPVVLKSPYTALDISIPNAVNKFGTGEVPISVELLTISGEKLAWLAKPMLCSAFKTSEMERQRKELLAKLETLKQTAEELKAKGNGVDLPSVSLTVAEMFLTNYIPDDFTKQKACVIAMKELSEIRSLLERAEGELRKPTLSAPLIDYDPTRPVEVKNGNFVQNGQPILLVGALSWTNQLDVIEWTKPLGFNSVVMDVAMGDWDGGNTKGNDLSKQILKKSKKAGIGVNFQLSAHHGTTLSAENLSAKGDDAGGNPGLPWNVVQPATYRVFGQWYDRMLPAFANYPNLINLGTVNEPTYMVGQNSKSFQAAFRKWAREQYKEIKIANNLWASQYTSFDTIDLPSFFQFREKSKGAAWDWSRFEAQMIGKYFGFLAQRIKTHLPNVSVSEKLVGEHGFGYLDEQEILFHGGQTVHGTDGAFSFYLDYIKSLDPELPVFDGEWHMIFSNQMGNDPAYLGRKMFQGVAHGIAAGYLWQWYRFEWNTQTHGAAGSITRYPLGLDGMGRASVKLRQLMPVMSRFANSNGGQIRLLYSKASHLHQSTAQERVLPGVQLLIKVPPYMQTLENLHTQLSANTSGVRFIIPEILKTEDLKHVKLIAAGSAEYIQSEALGIIESWVGQGGTLWLTSPGLACDPWGMAHKSVDVEFLQLICKSGSHVYKSGKIVVDEKWSGYETYLNGPKVLGADKQINLNVECRVASSEDGQTKYLYLVNTTDQPQTCVLSPLPKEFLKKSDLWNDQQVDLSKAVVLPPNGVLLFATNGRPTERNL
jgi:hypothetical protein